MIRLGGSGGVKMVLTLLEKKKVIAVHVRFFKVQVREPSLEGGIRAVPRATARTRIGSHCSGTEE